MPREFDGIAAIEAFKKLGEGAGTMRPKETNVIDEIQPEARLLERGGGPRTGLHRKGPFGCP
jgi:hypothetical protein